VLLSTALCFREVPGDSMNFQCWHMAADGAFYSRKGEANPC